MAKLLLSRLLEPNPMRRYSADQVLKHPWITRRILDNIPKTYQEVWRGREIRKKFIDVKLLLIH